LGGVRNFREIEKRELIVKKGVGSWIVELPHTARPKPCHLSGLHKDVVVGELFGLPTSTAMLDTVEARIIVLSILEPMSCQRVGQLRHSMLQLTKGALSEIIMKLTTSSDLLTSSSGHTHARDLDLGA